MTNEHRVHIVGIGDDGLEGLTVAARELISRAELVIASEHLLANLDVLGDKRSFGHDLDSLVRLIETNRSRRIVVLATGDPLFYGVARFLCDRLGKDCFEVLPHVSSMQLAFARVKESWDDAFLANLATQPLERMLEKARVAEKIGLFTSDAATPAEVAQAFLDAQLDYFSAYVCENLGSPDERVTFGSMQDIAAQEFAPLNVMILVRAPAVPDAPAKLQSKRLFGNRDEMFLQTRPKRGLLTPLEVRVLALAEMDLQADSVVWDVGAGSGAVAVEAARLAHRGKVYAIEMDPEDHELLRQNAERFQVGDSLVPVLGSAPEIWETLPEPDAIFIGGTGRVVGQISHQAAQQLKAGGRLVVNVSSVDNLLSVQQALAAASGDTHVRMIQVSHGTEQLDRIRFESMNPTFLISFVKS